MNAKITIPKLLSLVFISICFAAPADAYGDSISACHQLDISNSSIASPWYWLDDDTVVFHADNGIPQDGIGATEAWYEYRFSTDKLQEFTDPPSLHPAPVDLDPFIGIPPNQDQAKLVLSPSTEHLLYAHNDTYWLASRETGDRLDLGIDATLYEQPLVLWSGDEQRFIVEDARKSNAASPIKLVTLQGGKATVQAIEDIPALAQLGVVRGSYLYVRGLSLDGRYLLIEDVGLGENVQLLDLQENAVTSLSFYVPMDTPVVWTFSHRFVAATDLGVIEYDITRQSLRIVANWNDLNVNSTPLTLSPDGHFLIGQLYEQQANRTTWGIIVCPISL